ncbi:Hopanoid biosynthesis associated glycosyl transferase protein HpnI [Candidatus Terasakiella magnetica]|nr:Hopanoid biosynthesis associated glycosyl transferase protein HpnI [Candidatus Terasakiella magnetica]
MQIFLSLAGISFLVLCLRTILSFREAGLAAASENLPPLSILKPLCGDEPRLYECLHSFCAQDYPEFQIVFGVREDDDPAVAVVERLKADFPHRDIQLVCDGHVHGANLKISNVMNIMAQCRHDLLMVSDSDVEIAPGHFRAMATEMTEPNVAAVSCLYKGAAAVPGQIAALGAMNINHWIVPSVLLDVAMNGIAPTLGPVLMLRREALDKIGGFKVVADHLAEDHEIGILLHKVGFETRLSHSTIDTMVTETSLGALIRHEVRWAHTVRAVRPTDFLLSAVTWSLPVMLALHAFFPTLVGGVLLGLYVMLRLALHRVLLARFHFASPMSGWLVLPRECLCFFVWLISLFSRAVVWRGHPFRLLPGGRLVPLE